MGKYAFAQIISDAEVMINGIRDNQDILAKRQIDTKFADEMQADVNDCVALNNEQETLKAKTKEKTAEVDTRIADLLRKASEARKIIKMDMPQSSWREFGINDKR